MQNDSLRLELVRIVTPHASKLDMGSPERIIEKCQALEAYIVALDHENKTGQDAGAVARKRGRKVGEVAPSQEGAG